ncbi:MAG: hypothetical protein VYE04_03990, partial [Pseudomonadota bacterium]|nr:hypothetical protein [Pseudomonadota bacterium]
RVMRLQTSTIPTTGLKGESSLVKTADKDGSGFRVVVCMTGLPWSWLAGCAPGVKVGMHALLRNYGTILNGCLDCHMLFPRRISTTM